jgi:D-tyrosyl-tRNA(Tyr) deacylase
MKALIQRVSRGAVRVDGETVGQVGKGFVVLLGVREGDDERDARLLAHKTVNLRVFPDEAERMNRSLTDVDGGVLAVSQFTLYADTQKGNRPSFVQAAAPDEANRLYECYVAALQNALGEDKVATGRFRAMMEVEIVNDGPVTIELNTDR